MCHLSEYALYNIYMYSRKLCHSGDLGQLMGVAHDRTCTLALQTSRQKGACSLRRNWN